MENINDIKQQPRDIMHYESQIWEIADLLRSASIKQSDFPDYMMPFFALMMLEGRMMNAIKKVEEDEGITAESDPEDFEEAFKELDCGYNEFIVMQGKTLSSICDNDTTFQQDFTTYLHEFDDVLKRLLGIEREKTDMKYLNMDGIAAELRAKGILMDVVTAWSKIDLSAYDNSAITTLEEHIKRKWADISASTAGEQYTPDDIISLISEIVVSKLSKPKNEMVHIYDPTSGGANLLFGTEDRLAAQGYAKIATWGSEYNDKLYALAAIESRFRKNSTMHYGNTLTTVPYHGKKFDVIVANPPYGDKWSGFQKEIKNDQLRQFPGGLPAVSDGQLLFMQHILWQLHEEGIAVEVHNGSTLFSGNAGSGESNIRKYIFDKDWVEAIIQMPQNEFFNTGIYTYLWIMNKQKPLERKDKVALIDGSNLWQLLKKAKGDKRREMTPEHRAKIVDALTKFEDNDICKIFPREHFYYNCQSLTLTDLDDDGRSVVETICKDGKVKVSEGEYRFDEDRNTMIRTSDGEAVGCGKFTTKQRKDRKSGQTITDTYIEPAYINDYEIISHHFNQYENQREIDAFMQKYVFKPYKLDDNTIGVEINFNKEFYVPENVEKVEDLIANLQNLEKEMSELQSEIHNVVTRGLNPHVKLKKSGIDWIGMIPEHWKIRRIKDVVSINKDSLGEDTDETYKFRYIDISNVSSEGEITLSDEMYFYDAPSRARRIVRKGDVIVSTVRTYLRAIAQIDFEAKDIIASTGFAVLSPKECMCSSYLAYVIRSSCIVDSICAQSTGVSYPAISSSKLSAIDIPLPSLSEQQAIAAYLDEKCAKIDAAIENISKQIEASKRLKKAIINEAISGKEKI